MWRRHVFPCTAAAIVLLLAALVGSATANVMGVDLGLSFVKVSVARPGKGLELVTNEQAKRKTPAAVGFTDDGERLFGDAAVAYSGKAPARVILDGRNLIGKCVTDSKDGTLECQREVVTVAGSGTFTGEEVVAMLLGMARRQATASLDAIVKDVVITVPAWFDHRDRTAVTDAAKVIGLNCLAVVNANTAAAVKYALDGKGKTENKKASGKAARTQTVMFYDLGAGSATASIAQIVSDSKTGSASSVKMLGHEWELGVGGRTFDDVILDKMADDFDAQRGAGAAPSRDLPRVMMRLRKEAQRVREILSANTETVAAVPSLFDDVDFRTSVTRSDFEEGAAEAFTRAVAPVRRVLESTGLSVDDLDAVVPFGGASRTPRVQQLLREELGIASLNKSINSDEAAVMGTAFIAASMSSTFRVRKLDIEDVYGRSVSAEVEREEKANGMFSSGKAKPDAQKVVVFKRESAKLPAKKTLSFKRESDFAIDVYVDEDVRPSSRFPGRTLYARAKITGVAKVLQKVKDSKLSKSLVPQISLTLLMDRSGFIRFGPVESAVDEVVEVEKEIPIETTKSEEDIKSQNDKKLETGASAESRDKDAEASTEGENSSNSKDLESEKAQPKTRIEKSKQTLVHRQTLSVEFVEVPDALLSVQMNVDELKTSKKVLSDLEATDRDRQERADALNTLEGFILEVRSTIRSAEEGEALYDVTSSEQREEFIQALDAAEDWMYTHDAKVTKNLQSKTSSLRATYDSMKFRADELLARPEVTKSLRELLSSSNEKLGILREKHVNGGTTNAATLDELETLIKDTSVWLNDSLEKQMNTPLHAEPAFLSSKVDAKIKAIERKLMIASNLKVPDPVETDNASNETASADPSESVTGSGDHAVPEVGSSTADITSDSGAGHDEL